MKDSLLSIDKLVLLTDNFSFRFFLELLEFIFFSLLKFQYIFLEFQIFEFLQACLLYSHILVCVARLHQEHIFFHNIYKEYNGHNQMEEVEVNHECFHLFIGIFSFISQLSLHFVIIHVEPSILLAFTLKDFSFLTYSVSSDYLLAFLTF